MEWWEALLLVGGGIAAGWINAMAGGGSALTVPLLVLAGVPGNNANASNRVGVFTGMAAAAVAFRKLGVPGLARSAPVLVPVVAGSFVGVYGVTRLTDHGFERLFGILMLPVIFLSIRKPKVKLDAQPWSMALIGSVFFGVGVYGGAIQAGVGLVMLAALTRSGYDLVTANNIKVVAILTLTMAALPVFIIQGRVEWLPAIFLAAGGTTGSWIGAHTAVKGGESFIRGVMVVAALVLAGRLFGIYG